MNFPEARLCTGLPVNEAKALAREATEHQEWVSDLIRISSRPEGGTIPRKSSWVLRHAALLDANCIEGHARSILDAVNTSQDSSVHRELLKALLEASPHELQAMGEDLHELGLGLCADDTMPVAMVHVGVLLLHASGLKLGSEVAEVWRERGQTAKTASLARFLSWQLAALERDSV
jgi:hypothetical protein